MALRFTLRQLEYLVAVGETGAISLAADRLNVSAPSISAAIAHLEQDFGLPLFIRRHAQGLTPTKAGLQMLDQARQVLLQAGRLTDLAATITQTVQGPLHVGCLITFAQMVLPALRRGFTDRYPLVSFHQIEGDQSALYDGLRRGALDVALGYDLDVPGDLHFEPLSTLPPYAVLHPSHPLAGRQSVTAQDLAPHPMVLLDLPLSAEYFLSCFHSAGVSPRIAERTRDMGVMQGLVGQGFGYSIANIRPWSAHAPDGQPLVFVPLAGNVRQVRLGLLLPTAAPGPLTLRCFVSHCRDHLTAERVPGLRGGQGAAG